MKYHQSQFTIFTVLDDNSEMHIVQLTFYVCMNIN